MSIFYNVATIDISSGLTDYEISSGQDYFILLDAPTNANVTVKLNENTAPAIPIKEYWQFKSKNVQNIYLSCDAVSGESIKYGQADGNLEITTNPVINSIDSITSLTDVGESATNLDKIINPYGSVTLDGAGTNSTSLTTIYSATLDCDKIKLNFGATTSSGGNFTGSVSLHAILDGKYLATYERFSGYDVPSDNNIVVEGVNGKNLTIKASVYSVSDYVGFTMQKSSLKV